MPAKPSRRTGAPWEEWDLTAEFFAALSKWTAEHPESSLERVLDRVNKTIDLGREFFEVVPDGAFPARGLVKALAHLIKLGKTLSTAGRETQRFAREVVEWVVRIKTSFDHSRTRWRAGHFTRTSWRNLAHVRDLINEICKWAASRLSDSRWSLAGIKHKLFVTQEIEEFNVRIREAREIFKERSLICQAWGIDAILQMAWRIFERQKRIERVLKRIHETQAKHIKYVSKFYDAKEARRERQRYVTQMLSKHAITNASYDEQGKLPCDRGTRVDILKEIMAWVEDVNSTSQNFFWLTGDPGCGKSAITASIARECKDQKFLWAQFFINRNNVDTTNPNAFFPTVARQLATRSEDVELEIHDRLRVKPSLIDGISSEQAASLFIGAIRVASERDPKTPVVVVFDGFDETDRNHMKSTAYIFSRLFEELSDYPNAKVLIASRTEDDIRNPFARTMHNKCVKHLHLDTAAESSIKDVSMFLRRRISQIVLDNDLDWRVWPGDERMKILAQRASGLFIWAVTAAKFFQQQIDSWGTECLNDLLDKLNSDGMGDINTLYSLILSVIYKEQIDDWAFESFRRMIGAIVVLNESLCLNDIAGLLDLKRSPDSPPVDTLKFVRRLRTVLVAGTEAINGRTIPRLHKSFFEFITSNDRVVRHFHVDHEASHRELGFRCLRILATARSATSRVWMPSLFRYAFRFWSEHLRLGGLGTASGVAIDDSTLSISDLNNMITKSSNEMGSPPLFINYSPDKSLIQASLIEETLSWDVLSGMNPSTFSDRYQPHSSFSLPDESDWACAIAFLPGERIAYASSKGYLLIYDMETRQTVQQTLYDKQTHLGTVTCSAFSINGDQVVMGTGAGKLQIWETEPVVPSGASFGSSTCLMTCVAFSPVGDQLASGYTDGTIQLWSIPGGAPIRRVSEHSLSLSTIKFSPDGAYILTCATKEVSAKLWNTRTGMVCQLCPSTAIDLGSVAFLNTELAITGHSGGHIFFWDVQSGQQIGEPLFDRQAVRIEALEVSRDGKYIISGSEDNYVGVWDVGARKFVTSFISSPEGTSPFVASSPSGQFICSGSLFGNSVEVWSEVDLFCRLGHPSPRSEINAFAPDGEHILSVFANQDIRYWDARYRPPRGTTLKTWFDHDADDATLSSFRCINSASGYQGILATFSDGRSRSWTMVDDELTPSVSYPIPDGEQEHPHHPREPAPAVPRDTVRWFPSDNPGYGLWALIDNRIIRARTDGSVTVVPVSINK